MTPHPPSFLTIDQYDGVQECSEPFIYHAEIDAEVCDDEDSVETSEVHLDNPETSTYYDNLAAFLETNYEEGAESLYYKEYEQDPQDDYDEDDRVVMSSMRIRRKDCIL